MIEGPVRRRATVLVCIAVAVTAGVGTLARALAAPTVETPRTRPHAPQAAALARARSGAARDLVVAFSPAAGPGRRKAVLAPVGGEEVEGVPGTDVFRVRLPVGADRDKAAKKLRSGSGVRLVRPVNVVRAFAVEWSAVTPNDPQYWRQWGLPQAQFDDAWAVTTATGRTVAVIDSGVDASHPDLTANMWTNATESAGAPGVDDDGNGYIDDIHGWNFIGTSENNNYDDVFGHGTHVAGIAAATTNNGIGVAGAAPGARIMALKMLNSQGVGDDFDLIQAIHYAKDNGASVANMSLGGEGQNPALDSACASAAANGVVLCAAVGNDGDTAAGGVVNYPAASPGVLAVAATDQNDVRASFSNYGNASQYPEFVAAPGVSVYSTLPDHYTLLSAIYGYNYGTLSGTSMATPHVAALAALARSHAPTLTAAQTIDRIQDTADAVGAYRFYGAGRINAYVAVEGTSTYPPPAPSDPREPNDVTSTASPVLASVGTTSPSDAYLFGAGDRDVYAVDTTVPGHLSATVYGAIDIDVALAYLGSTGVTQQVVNAAGVRRVGSTGNESLSTTVPSGGRYFVSVGDAYSGWSVRDYAFELAFAGDTAAPTVQITSPAAGAYVDTTLTVSATASDDFGVAAVEFRRDGETTPTVTTGPYTMMWDLSGAADGSAHTVEAQAVDTSGNRSSKKSRSVTVDHSPPVIYKLFASPSSFSPNGDGTRDRTRIYQGFWDSVTRSGRLRVQIVTTSGGVVRDFGARSRTNGLASIVWDGRDGRRRAVPAARYVIRANAQDASGKWAATAYAPLRIDRSRPIVLSPRTDAARRRVTVRAYDISSPLNIEVRALTAGGSVAWRAFRKRVPSGPSYWGAPWAAFSALRSGGRLRILAIDAAGNRRVAYFR